MKEIALFTTIPFINQIIDKNTLLGIKKFSTDLVLDSQIYTAAHWGALKVSIKNGKIIKSQNAFDDFVSNPLQSVVADLIEGKHTNRIKAPMVRKSYLEKKADNKNLRGVDEWVEISYQKALELVSDEIKRVRKEKGPSGIYGGSYGWKSSGNFHNARTLLHRFLALGGGFVNGLGDYSTGAAQVILPHVLGTLEVYEQQTSYPLILQYSKVIVIWGANPINTLKIAWNAPDNQGFEFFKALKKSDKTIICIDPIKNDTIEFFGDKAQWIAPLPNTDVALMLGIIHTMLTNQQYDKDFIQHYTQGFSIFAQYVLGKEDKIPKDAKWASKISRVPQKQIKTLAKLFFENRTILMAGWNMQRQHHGEQVHWMLVTLASMIGQIGLPGGGFGFSYHYGNGGSPTTNAPIIGGMTIGNARRKWFHNGASCFIPVARIVDCLNNPGKTIRHNGKTLTYPDIDLIYWVGGNPLVHHQNTNSLIKAWKKPTTIIVNEMYWTPTAKMADIVFPITTPYERNDITMSGDYSNLHILPMKQITKAIPNAKSDFEVFANLSKLCGFAEAFTENKTEMEWIEDFYNIAYETAKRSNILMADNNPMPDFATFWKNNRPLCFAPTPKSKEFVRYADFRKNPILNPLNTPSGKIEIYSETIKKMHCKDCGAYPQWFEPIEWLGMKDKKAQFALVSSHPSLRLHSQLGNTSLREQYAIANCEPIWINPADAKTKGIKNGDLVRVFNKRGQILAGAVLSDIVPRGVVRICEGAWYDPQNLKKARSLCKNGNVNVLTIDIPSSELSNGCIANTALVNIEKFKGKAPHLSAFMPPKGAN